MRLPQAHKPDLQNQDRGSLSVCSFFFISSNDVVCEPLSTQTSTLIAYLCLCFDEFLCWLGRRGSPGCFWAEAGRPCLVLVLSSQARSEHLLRVNLLCSQHSGRQHLPICLHSVLYHICTYTAPVPLAHSQFINESGFCPHGWASCCPSGFSTFKSQHIFL